MREACGGTAASRVLKNCAHTTAKLCLTYTETAWKTAPNKREVVRASNTLTQVKNVHRSRLPDYMLIYFDLKGFWGEEKSPMPETPTL